MCDCVPTYAWVCMCKYDTRTAPTNERVMYMYVGGTQRSQRFVIFLAHIFLRNDFQVFFQVKSSLKSFFFQVKSSLESFFFQVKSSLKSFIFQVKSSLKSEK